MIKRLPNQILRNEAKLLFNKALNKPVN